MYFTESKCSDEFKVGRIRKIGLMHRAYRCDEDYIITSYYIMHGNALIEIKGVCL